MSEPPQQPAPQDLSHFMVGVGSWFGSFGLHGVLFSTLLVVELQETELRVGAAQSALLIPSVILMLAGGAVADRVHRARLLTRLHLAGSLIALALCAALTAGWLSYPLLLLYALAFGALQAFVNPTRDALLSEVAGTQLARSVALMNLTQWGSQATGALVASGARLLGAAPFFFLQSLVLAAGMIAFARMEGRPPTQRPALTFSELLDGIREVVRTPDLLATWILACAVGVLFIGPFMVVFPLMVRDVYHHGAGEIALVSACFPLGTITGSIVIMRRGGLKALFPAQWRALCVGASILISTSLDLPFWGLLLCIYGWGVTGAIFMIAGRTTFQQRASAENRGRVLATYTMGVFGSAGLFGAPLSGGLAGLLGPQNVPAVLGVTMLALVSVILVSGMGRRPTPRS